MHRLSEGAVARGIPYGKSNPLLSRGVEWNSATPLAKRRLIGRDDKLSANLLAVAPNCLEKLQWKCPFDVSDDLPPGALAFDGPVLDEHFAGRYEKLAGAQRLVDGAPVLEAGHALQLYVVHVEIAVQVVVGEFLVGIDFADHFLWPTPVVHVVERAKTSTLAEPFL